VIGVIWIRPLQQVSPLVRSPIFEDTRAELRRVRVLVRVRRAGVDLTEGSATAATQS